MSISVYEENQILGASPMDLVRILYGGAVRAVRQAREHLRTGDIAARSREIHKAQMIVVELANAVDRTQAADFGGRLVAVYDYMLRRLAEANVEQNDAPLAEAAKLLATLQEGWAACPAEQS